MRHSTEARESRDRVEALSPKGAARHRHLGTSAHPGHDRPAGQRPAARRISDPDRFTRVAPYPRRRLPSRVRGSRRDPRRARPPCRSPLVDGCADAVVSIDVLQLLDDPASLLGEAARLLRPAGRLVLTTWEGQGASPGAPVFTTRAGEALYPVALNRAWTDARRATGLTHLHLHDLRHTGNTFSSRRQHTRTDGPYGSRQRRNGSPRQPYTPLTRNFASSPNGIRTRVPTLRG